jgi:hypothetical protein
MRNAELRALVNRVVFWLFPLSFVLAGLAVAFLWVTNERRASATDQVVVGQTQPLPDKPRTRGRIQ